MSALYELFLITDLKREISYYLDFYDVINLELVNRTFYQIFSKDDHLWKYYLTKYFLGPNEVSEFPLPSVVAEKKKEKKKEKDDPKKESSEEEEEKEEEEEEYIDTPNMDKNKNIVDFRSPVSKREFSKFFARTLCTRVRTSEPLPENCFSKTAWQELKPIMKKKTIIEFYSRKYPFNTSLIASFGNNNRKDKSIHISKEDGSEISGSLVFEFIVPFKSFSDTELNALKFSLWYISSIVFDQSPDLEKGLEDECKKKFGQRGFSLFSEEEIRKFEAELRQREQQVLENNNNEIEDFDETNEAAKTIDSLHKLRESTEKKEELKDFITWIGDERKQEFQKIIHDFVNKKEEEKKTENNNNNNNNRFLFNRKKNNYLHSINLEYKQKENRLFAYINFTNLEEDFVHGILRRKFWTSGMKWSGESVYFCINQVMKKLVKKSKFISKKFGKKLLKKKKKKKLGKGKKKIDENVVEEEDKKDEKDDLRHGVVKKYKISWTTFISAIQFNGLEHTGNEFWGSPSSNWFFSKFLLTLRYLIPNCRTVILRGKNKLSQVMFDFTGSINLVDRAIGYSVLEGRVFTCTSEYIDSMREGRAAEEKDKDLEKEWQLELDNYEKVMGIEKFKEKEVPKPQQQLQQRTFGVVDMDERLGMQVEETKPIQVKDYTEENQKLVGMGFTNVIKNRTQLQKYNGSIEEVVRVYFDS